tara:strand:- start:820 stop:1467 length:648 start_codon:yes stop_codon:yes gene_type:complete
MLIKIRTIELQKLIPAVATGNQFRSTLGDPRKILQRILISSIGGVITLLISQNQVSSQFYPLWLIIGVCFLLYLLWGPILEASRKNSNLRRYNHGAIFDGQIGDIFTREKVENRQEQVDKNGKLVMVENRRTWLFCELEDEDGYLAELSFPFEKEHQSIRIGTRIYCLVLSNNSNFNGNIVLTDAWIPQKRIWVGEYPYLLRPAFEEICKRKIIN